MIPIAALANLALYLDDYIARCDDARGRAFDESRAIAFAALTHVRSLQSGRAGDPDAVRLHLVELFTDLARRTPPTGMPELPSGSKAVT